MCENMYIRICLLAHRYHGNRIMHETFLGEENFKTAHPDIVKSVE